MTQSIDPTASPVQPGPAFGLIVGATAGLGFLLWNQQVASRFYVFAFVVVGWVLSLTLHEFAHAYTAWRAGDHSVAARGYLTLDPRLYSEPMLSIGMPVLFVLMGGFGLPGGAVWIDRRQIPNRWHLTAVSLAGPAANLLFGIIVLAPVGLGWVSSAERPSLVVALSFLGALQAAALVLNLLPIPPFDGYGAIEPHLSPAIRRQIAPVGRYGILVLIGALWLIDPVNALFWDTVYALVELIDVPRQWVRLGAFEFRFWEQ
ncbi:MAG: site-2 protease family protein [Actinomycetia bacterium]|nr:site-2 protease family protein [Actinomycetes bacterium]